MGKGENEKLAFSPFPTLFSTLPEINFNFSAKFNLSSANAFNLDQSKNFSFGKEFNYRYKQTSLKDRKGIQIDCYCVVNRPELSFLSEIVK